MNTCVACAKEFEVKPKTTGKYCSAKCWYSVDRRTLRTCQRCGIMCFGKANRKFCGKVCANKSFTKLRSESPLDVPGCRWIGVGSEKHALVDDLDFEALSQHLWRLSKGAATTFVGGRLVQMHRMILTAPAGVLVDHANGNQLDNRRTNLRLATSAQNAHNSIKKRGRSRFKGVYLDSNRKWSVSVRNSGRRRWLGAFVREVDAALAYDQAARELFGAFACVNMPRPGERSAIPDGHERAFRLAAHSWLASGSCSNKGGRAASRMRWVE